jgi:predicted nucleotidyltransferase component of viral defense system
MNNSKKKNIAHSVKERLKILAKQQDRKHQDLILSYMIERFLYRMSVSKYSDNFILKDALMLQVLGEECTRATRDIDFMCQSDLSLEECKQIVIDIINQPGSDDGVVFDVGTVKAIKIQKSSREGGVRVSFIGHLEMARANLQIDIGPYYRVIPSPLSFYFPQLLNYGCPNLLGYSAESIIADKFEAMVSRDETNTRLKDFYDIWVLSTVRYFESSSLREAIEEIFSYYGTAVPQEMPICFQEIYYANKSRQKQWETFLKNARLDASNTFAQVNESVQNFLMPVCLNQEIGKNIIWNPTKGWTENTTSN